MLLIFGSNRERSLRGLFIRYLKRRKKKLLQELCLEPRTLTWLALAPRTSQVLKGLICLEDRSQIKWMSLYSLKSWKQWKMFCLRSMKKQGKKRRCAVSVKILVTWLQRMRKREKEKCKKRMASRRRRTSSFRARSYFFLSLQMAIGDALTFPLMQFSPSHEKRICLTQLYFIIILKVSNHYFR
uniref:Uncharacterized protein n=1 Tax=Lotus japonicus TaxID=34305 RepID=I3SR60_LOTJA|nr:unknown [Lotus japonicus]